MRKAHLTNLKEFILKIDYLFKKTKQTYILFPEKQRRKKFVLGKCLIFVLFKISSLLKEQIKKATE